jgi:predicted NAD-dependent protein-ADP-ribosyltransferase YbiA (DUF1768 family)
MQAYWYGAQWVDRNGQSVRNKRRGPRTYHVFENEFPVAVVYEGETYPSAFHAYQAARFAAPEDRAPLAAQRAGGPRAMSLHEARAYGSSTKLALVPNFGKDRELILEEIVRAKFASNARLLVALLRTGDAEMRYDSPSPTWGFDGGSGQNMHGKVLARVRDELRASVQHLREGEDESDARDTPTAPSEALDGPLDAPLDGPLDGPVDAPPSEPDAPSEAPELRPETLDGPAPSEEVLEAPVCVSLGPHLARLRSAQRTPFRETVNDTPSEATEPRPEAPQAPSAAPSEAPERAKVIEAADRAVPEPAAAAGPTGPTGPIGDRGAHTVP